MLKNAISRPAFDHTAAPFSDLPSVRSFAAGSPNALIIELARSRRRRPSLQEDSKRLRPGSGENAASLTGSRRKVIWRRSPPDCSDHVQLIHSPKRVAISSWPLGDQPSGVGLARAQVGIHLVGEIRGTLPECCRRSGCRARRAWPRGVPECDRTESQHSEEQIISSHCFYVLIRRG